MTEQYYKIKITTNSTPKNYIVSALHELQAKNRLIKELKLKYNDIAQIKNNAML